MTESIKDTEDEQNIRQSENYKCSECGAPMRFDPSTSTLICDYCGNKIVLEGEKTNKEFDFSTSFHLDNSWQKETKIFHCKNCGANTVVSIKELSITCPFCGSTEIAETSDLPGIRPHRVIPFKLDAASARKVYSQWLKKKFFAPNKVKKSIPTVAVNGIYLPMWTYDTQSFSKYSGRLGKYYTVTVGSGKSRHTETRVRYFLISGVKQVNFDDLLVDAGKKVNQAEVNRLSPFGTNDALAYDQRYLAGFSAEHYDVDVKAGWDIAKGLAKPYIERAILSAYTYDVVDSLNVSTTYTNIKYKYVLIPLWMGHYSYNKKQYYFKVNGETSKLIGQYPVSPVKVTITVLVCLVILVGFVILFTVFGENDSSDFDFETVMFLLKNR
jgi:DNA-directed RNA polymerase subunit RPC12/RpoP